MVALTGELGEPPDRILDLWRLDELRGIALDGDAVMPRRPDDVHGDPPLGAVPRAPAGAGRGGRDDRRGPDPEPRHARRQHRQRLAGRRHAAGPAGGRRRRSCSARSRGERTVAAADFWPAYRRTALAPDELLLRIRIPLLAGREMRFRKVGTRRAQSISKVVLALAWRDGSPADAAGATSGVALGSVAATPIRARATEAALEGAPPTPETADRAAETLAAELKPIDDVRSTAEYRRLVAARVLHRLIREAGGW